MGDHDSSAEEFFDQVLETADDLKRLARRILRDAASVDDVVQEVWLAALEHPPEQFHNARGWARTVLRRVAIQHAKRSRRDRPSESVEELSLADSDPRIDEGAVGERLRQAVGRLPEPYGEVVRLRYLEGLSPAEVAARTGRPESTINTQAMRGLDRLRERLEGTYGDSRSLGLALVFAFRWSPEDLPSSTSGRGPAHGNASPPTARGKIVLLAGAAAVALLTWVTLTRARPEGPVAEPEAVSQRDEAQPEPVAVGGTRESLSERPLETPEDPAPGERQAVRVVDSSGQGVPGAEVLVVVEEESGYASRAVTDAEGRASVPVLESDVLALMRARPVPVIGFLARREGAVGSDVLYVEGVREDPLTLTVGGGEVVVTGCVAEAGGRREAGVQIFVDETEVDARPRKDGTWIARPVLRTVTGTDGTYRIAGIAPGAHRLLARKQGVAIPDGALDMPSSGRAVVDLLAEPGVVLKGRVLDADGQPVAGARVYENAILGQETRSDELGRYELRGLCLRGYRPPIVTAEHEGTAALCIAFLNRAITDHDFRMVGSRRLAVRVVDEQGAGVPNAVVKFSALDCDWSPVLRTDADGVASPLGAPDGDVRARVFGPLDDVRLLKVVFWFAGDTGERAVGYRPNDPDLTVVRGICTAADGDLLAYPSAIFLQHRKASLFVGPNPLDPLTGAFEATVQPGRYEVEIRTPQGATVLAPLLAERGGEVDLGALVCPEPTRFEIECEFEEVGDLRYRIYATHRYGRIFEIQSGDGLPPPAVDVLPGLYDVYVTRNGRDHVRSTLVRTGVRSRARIVEGAPGAISAFCQVPDECGDEEATFVLTGVPTDTREALPIHASRDAHLSKLGELDGTLIDVRVAERESGGWFIAEWEVEPGKYNVLVETAGGWWASSWVHVQQMGGYGFKFWLRQD